MILNPATVLKPVFNALDALISNSVMLIPSTWIGRKCRRWCCVWKKHSKSWKKR
jgi:hypothetical protein